MHACSASSWTVGNDVANIKHPVSDVRSSPNKRSSSPFYSPLMTGLEKRTGVESCEALNPYPKENADDVLAIISTQILEEMDSNGESDASGIENAAHMKSGPPIPISGMEAHAAPTVKPDLRISGSDWGSFSSLDLSDFDLNYKSV